MSPGSFLLTNHSAEDVLGAWPCWRSGAEEEQHCDGKAWGNAFFHLCKQHYSARARVTIMEDNLFQPS